MVMFLIYLVKVSASMLGLFLIYYFLLRQYTFHHVNRVCLLLVLLFSFVVPLVSVSGPGNPIVPILMETSAYYDYYGNDWNFPAEQVQQQSYTGIGIDSLLVTVYLLGVIVLSYRFLKSLIMLCRLGRETDIEMQNSFRIRRTNLKASFTFLNTIFLPKEEDDAIILKHEQAHVKQFHWIDLLVVEIAAIILWFNPVLVLLKHELRLQHEFLADRSVMADGVSFEDYAQCLVKNLSSGVSYINTISPLHSTSNKKRILMMAKTKTSSWRLVFYLLMVPVTVLMLMSFGRKQNEVLPEVTQVSRIDGENIPDISPVDLTKVTQVLLYGEILDPRTNKLRNHTGIDFALSKGSDVVATADGVVIVQAYGEKRGNHVIIRHNEIFSTRYFHFERALVKRGDRVKKGQVIGLVGNTGLSTTPHLHYEVLKNYARVDPKEYLPPLPAL